MLGFLLVVARVAGVFIFVPLPGMRSTPEVSRIVLVLGLAMALVGRWPNLNMQSMTAGAMVAAILAEAATGLAMGVAVSVLLESFNLAAQFLGLQAGYAYASTIDPNTQADSGVLMVISQLAAGMMFFATGLDRAVVLLLAESLEKIPPGAYVCTRLSAERLIALASIMFSVGLRLAMPVIALLLMVDFALALLGRLNAQLQLITLAFPIKMLVSLGMLGWGMWLFPRLLVATAEHIWHGLRPVLGL
jgi:flagellar biosynthetic protein FliR